MLKGLFSISFLASRVVAGLPMSSLAGDYLVRCTAARSSSHDEVCRMHLVPIGGIPVKEEFSHSEGAKSWAALHEENPLLEYEEMVLEASVQDSTISVTTSENETSEFGLALARILALWTISRKSMVNQKCVIDLTSLGGERYYLDHPGSNACIQELYDSEASSEIVEMVDRDGNSIGCVPRKLVHKYNLLHRGIGIFITKDRPLQSTKVDKPDLYCHQRTSTKRIFPSLYDMFVGGVSATGEDSRITARRELAEELGLTDESHMSKEKILTCVICTAYNRCVVDLFSYVMDTSRETVTWQPEEVAWGSFIPYSDVEASADLSIQRLAARQEWPGRFPPIQSRSEKRVLSGEWDTWDYVPDGLLVWEGWLRHLNALQVTTDQ